MEIKSIKKLISIKNWGEKYHIIVCEVFKRNAGSGLVNEVVRRVGVGDRTAFWTDWWVGERPLAEEFNRLFRVGSQQESKLSEVGRREGNEWIWEFVWRRG